MGAVASGRSVIKGVGGLCDPLCAPASGTMGTLPMHYGFPAVRDRAARKSDNQTAVAS